MIKRLTVLVVLLLVLILVPGCKSEDVFSSLGQASGYVAGIGVNMQDRGWSDFPTNAIDLVRYVADLRASISEAKNNYSRTTTAKVSSLGAMAAMPIDPNPDLKSLKEAFRVNGEW